MRLLMVVSAQVVAERARTDQRAAPRTDYHALIETLDASVIDPTSVRRSRFARLVERIAGTRVALAWLAFQVRGEYKTIFTDGEQVGIPLALLLKATRSATRHVTIGHRITAPKKRLFFRRLRVQDRMDRIIVHARRQEVLATAELAIPAERLALMPYQVDVDFWRPIAVKVDRLICTAGLEFRDYPTLIRATRDLDVQVVIGAASHWSKRRDRSGEVERPANVSVSSFDYLALRELYARAAIVVVPLEEIDFQAGVTTILEAMAMAKPVIVTRTSGQTDVIEDRRGAARWERRAETPRSLIRELATAKGLPLEPNGFYVPPGDSEVLRRAIAYLLDHPEERERLGRAGRRAAEHFFSLETFVERVSRVLREVDASGPLLRQRRGLVESGSI